MNNTVEQRIGLKFCGANDITCADAMKLLKKAYGDAIISKTRAYEWYKALKEGREEFTDLHRRAGFCPAIRCTESNINKIKEMVIENRYYSSRELADELSIAYCSVRKILFDILGLRRIESIFVPKELNFLQKEQRKVFAQDMLTRAAGDASFIERVITGGEIYIHGCDVETQTNELVDPLEIKPFENIRPKHKVMLICFFDLRGVVHAEFLPKDEKLDKKYYLNILKRLVESIQCNRADLWVDNSYILHHDSTPLQKSLIVRTFLAQNSIKIIEQPTHSPDLAPSNFFLNPKLKYPLRGKNFVKSAENIKEYVQKTLQEMHANAYEQCMKDLIKRWQFCVNANGDYFEEDNKDSQ